MVSQKNCAIFSRAYCCRLVKKSGAKLQWTSLFFFFFENEVTPIVLSCYSNYELKRSMIPICNQDVENQAM